MSSRRHAPIPLRIEYPATLNSDGFEQAIGVLGPEMPSGTRIEIDHTQTTFALLDVLVSALYLYNELAQLNNEVTLRWGPDQPTFGYADFMGFFQLLDARVEVHPQRPVRGVHRSAAHSNPSLLEMTSLQPGDRSMASGALDLLRERLAENLATVRNSAAVVDNIWTFAAETIGNIDEHSQTPVPGVVAAQRYKSQIRGSRIHLVIADGGLGIPATIRTGNPVAAADKTDVEIIIAAFKDGLSRQLARGRGCGLTTCARIAMLYKGNLRVRVGRTWARLITKSARSGLSLGFFEDEATPISGTHISLDFYLDRLERLG